jgi:two-component system response regulator DesR
MFVTSPSKAHVSRCVGGGSATHPLLAQPFKPEEKSSAAPGDRRRPSSRDPQAGPRILLAVAEAVQAGVITEVLRARCVVTATGSVRETESAIESSDWDGFIVDADLQGEDGVGLLAVVRRRFPREPLLLICCCGSADASREAMVHRAYFVTKPLTEQGATSFQQVVLDSRQGTKAELMARLRDLGLTSRETEVIALLAQGATAANVAAQLAISTRTVQGHCFAIYSRLGAKNLAAVVAMANGWVSQ